MARKFDSFWNRSLTAEDRLRKKGSSPDYYEGRHVIKRDTPIDGGVSIGGSAREAIVVNLNNSPTILGLYHKVKERIQQVKFYRKRLILPTIFHVVRDALPYQENDLVEQMGDSYDLQEDRRVSLEFYVQKGIGVCRHSALTVGVLVEKFIKDGVLGGRISIDRNETPEGAHEWARYTSSDGKILILDVTQGYCGLLQESKNKGTWPYHRPEDPTQ